MTPDIEVTQIGRTWTATATRGRAMLTVSSAATEAEARALLLAEVPDHWVEVIEALSEPEWVQYCDTWEKSKGSWTLRLIKRGTKWWALAEDGHPESEENRGAHTWTYRTAEEALDALHAMCAAWAPADALAAMKGEVPT